MACRCQGQHDFACMERSHQIVSFVGKGSNDSPPPTCHPAPSRAIHVRKGGESSGQEGKEKFIESTKKCSGNDVMLRQERLEPSYPAHIRTQPPSMGGVQPPSSPRLARSPGGIKKK